MARSGSFGLFRGKGVTYRRVNKAATPAQKGNKSRPITDGGKVSLTLTVNLSPELQRKLMDDNNEAKSLGKALKMFIEKALRAYEETK